MSQEAPAKPAADGGLAKTTALLGLFSLGGYATTLVLQSVIAYKFGAGRELDAFFVGATLPRIVVEWFLMSAATIVLVPLLTQAAAQYGEEEVRRVANTFMTLSLLFVAVVSTLCAVFALPIARAIAPGLGEDVHRLSAGILRLLMATSIVSGVGAMFRGVLHAERRFVLPAAAMNLQGLVSIAAVLLLGGVWGVWSVAVGTVLGAAMYAGLLFFPISETHHRFRPQLDLKDPVVRRIMALFLPFLIIGIGAQINFLSDRWFASFLSEGAVSLMTYADKIKTPLLGVFAVSVTTPMYTIFSEHSAAEDLPRLRETVRRGMRAIALISLPVVAVFLALREPTIRFLLERGAFRPEDTAALSAVMLRYGPALVTWSFGILLMHAIFSTQDVYWAVWIILIEIACNIGLDWLFLRVWGWGVEGLPLATSIAVTTSNVLLWAIFSRKVGGLDARSLLFYTAKVGAAAALGGAAAALVRAGAARALPASALADLGTLAVGGAAGLGLYALALTALRIPEWTAFRGKLARRPAPAQGTA